MHDAGEILEGIFESAREMFLEDGNHPAMFFLLRAGEMVGMGPLNAETQEQRDSVIRQMAATVADEGIDAVIIVSEVWEAGTMPASRAADRREFLTGMLAIKQGDGVHLRAAIDRHAGDPALGETEAQPLGQAFIFAPIYEVWGRAVD